MQKVFSVLFAVALIASVNADLYIHSPPGANDRNRERNDNRANEDRLYDSQNNAKGGYPWRGDPTVRAKPDPLTYYAGSVLRVEWTNQHACGENPNLVCDIIAQYACDTIADNLANPTRATDSGADLPGLRDGYPDSETTEQVDAANTGYLQRRFSGQAGQNQQGTNTIPSNQYADDSVKRTQFYTLGLFGGVEFGMHETYDMYATCQTTTRNKGLYTADQKVNVNDARGTRQNPNGGRRGLECPEERDYYPYWNGYLNPWHDVAILTNNISRCDYFLANSPNVKAYGYCSNYTGSGLIPITKDDCQKNGQGIWNPGAPKGPAAPDCLYHPYNRDNHLGNTIQVDAQTGTPTMSSQPETPYYLWTIPDAMTDKRCTLRLRYNISTLDYPSNYYSLDGGTLGVGIDSSKNCENVITADGTNVDDLSQTVSNAQCIENLLTDASRPLTNRPYVDVFGRGANMKLSLAINTNQAGRTFQDRTYVFDVRQAPVSGKIFNLGIRGRRGNIVQCYPAVEYDFVPQRLSVSQGDILHVQVHGSDYNEAKNANNGEGWQYSDRSNMVQFEDPAQNIPSPRTKISLFSDQNVAYRWALLDQTNCKAYKNGDQNEQNAIDNCGKLNSAPQRFPQAPEDGLMIVTQSSGTYYYGSTRNNNFSNRSQKAQLAVNGTSGLSAGQVAGITIGTLAAAGILVGALLVYGKKRPNSKLGHCYRSMADSCTNCGNRANRTPATTTTTGTTSSTPSASTAVPDMVYQRHGTNL